MLALNLPAKGPNRGGALHKCLLCNQPGCERHEPCCPRCRTNCWLCGTVKAVENCDRCVRMASRELKMLKRATGNTIRVERLDVISVGAEALKSKDAQKLLKNSGLNEKVIRNAAGGGEAGTKALKDAALVWVSKLEQVYRGGGDVRKFCEIARGDKEHLADLLPTPAAFDAVDAFATRRGIEPMYRDVPAESLAIAAELVAEAGREVTDALVLADLTRALAKVNGKIVQKVHNSYTHYHGWRASKIEALEAFARREAEKAIKLVLSRSRAAVEARRAKERPKKKRMRALNAKSKAKIKKAKAEGTYKHSRTGDTKKHFKKRKNQRDRLKRMRLAYNKVERPGPGACTRARRWRLIDTRSIKRGANKRIEKRDEAGVQVGRCGDAMPTKQRVSYV